MATIEGSLINKENFHKFLLEKLNTEMVLAAEPILEKALEDIENEMRKKLASIVVSFLDGYIELDRMGECLRILVKHEHPK